MLSESIQKVKQYCQDNKTDLYTAFIIFFTAVGSFGLGRLSAILPRKEPITVNQSLEQRAKNPEDINQAGLKNSLSPLNSKTPKQSSAADGRYVASKSGTSYHYPWCPSAAKIKEENKIWFDTKEEAESAGYKPAGNCEGL